MSELKVTTLKHADSAVDSIVMASDGTLAFGAAVTDSAGVAIQGGGAAQAWVNFQGTGTVAIRASYNVSSITDNGTAVFTINFTTAMPDINYVVSGTSMRVSANTTNGASGSSMQLAGDATYGNTFTTSSVKIMSKLNNDNMEDGIAVTVAIFR